MCVSPVRRATYRHGARRLITDIALDVGVTVRATLTVDVQTVEQKNKQTNKQTHTKLCAGYEQQAKE
jgi:hypothetical protein